jgi:hypothetical protein
MTTTVPLSAHAVGLLETLDELNTAHEKILAAETLTETWDVYRDVRHLFDSDSPLVLGAARTVIDEFERVCDRHAMPVTPLVRFK